MPFLGLSPLRHLNQILWAMPWHLLLSSWECSCIFLSPENGQLSFSEADSISRGKDRAGSLNSRLTVVSLVPQPQSDDSWALPTWCCPKPDPTPYPSLPLLQVNSTPIQEVRRESSFLVSSFTSLYPVQLSHFTFAHFSSSPMPPGSEAASLAWYQGGFRPVPLLPLTSVLTCHPHTNQRYFSLFTVLILCLFWKGPYLYGLKFKWR